MVTLVPRKSNFPMVCLAFWIFLFELRMLTLRTLFEIFFGTVTNIPLLHTLCWNYKRHWQIQNVAAQFNVCHKKLLYMRPYHGTYQWRTVVKMLLCLFVCFFRFYKSVIAKSIFLFLKHPFFNTYQETTTEKARTRAGPSLIICLACSLQLL